MERPEWVPAPAWARLETALSGQPEHANDALADLEGAAEAMDLWARAALVDRFCVHAGLGVPLPAAFLLALNDLLEAGRE